ncbi:MAG: DNA polymerase III subunit gamma/tau [Syntrophomonadaceae bacterium]|jgi:DNA polymerase-3 subunit gamma/tau
MSYLALYRVWRPGCFKEVVGQEQTVTALRNAVKEERLSHAYLFSGPRGTGKTSVAKILAKAANCENLNAGEPCNQCSACRDITNGNFMDVVEIDAASNRGIDEIRDLRSKVRILPAQGKKKVYIIDEVHMLTTEAFNALLKTLEEPPDSVIFILATTELHKIPATILSRCQNYSFRRLTVDEISNQLARVAKANDIELQDRAGELISRRANGGLRDALSLLDQIFSYKGQSITVQDVLDVLGLVDEEFMARLMEAVFAQDIPVVIETLGAALNQGKEAPQIIQEAALYLRDLLMYQLVGNQAELSLITEEGKKLLETQKSRVNKNQIMQALKLLMDAGEKLKYGDGQRFLLEICFMGVINIFALEKSQPAALAPQPKVKPAAPERVNKDPSHAALWNKLLAGVKEKKIPTHALLSQGRLLGIKDDTIYVGFRKGYKFHKEKMEEKSNRDIFEAVLKEVLGRELESQFIFLDDNQYNDIIVKKAIEYFGEDIVEIKD